MALGPRSKNRRSVEGRRCKACGRGMAMVDNPTGGRYCRWCGYDPTDATLRDSNQSVAQTHRASSPPEAER